MQPLQPLVLQAPLWCSQVLRKQGFLTLHGAVASQDETVPWADGITTEEAITALLFLNGQSLWILHLGPQVDSQPPETYSPCDELMTIDWLEPENVVWPAAGQTGPGDEITVEDHEPEAGLDPISGCELIAGDAGVVGVVGDGSDGPRFVGTGDRSGAAGLGWAPGVATGDGTSSRPSDVMGGGSGMVRGCAWGSIDGAATAGGPGFRAGTAAEFDLRPRPRQVHRQLAQWLILLTVAPGRRGRRGRVRRRAIGIRDRRRGGRLVGRRRAACLGRIIAGRHPGRGQRDRLRFQHPRRVPGGGHIQLVGLVVVAVLPEPPDQRQPPEQPGPFLVVIVGGVPVAGDHRSPARLGPIRGRRRGDRLIGPVPAPERQPRQGTFLGTLLSRVGGLRPAQAMLHAGAARQAQQQYRHDPGLAKPPHGVSSRLVVVDPSDPWHPRLAILLSSSMGSAHRPAPADRFGGSSRPGCHRIPPLKKDITIAASDTM